MVEEYALEQIGNVWQLRDGSQLWEIGAADHAAAVTAVCRLMRGWIRPRKVLRIDRFTATYSVVVAVSPYHLSTTFQETM